MADDFSEIRGEKLRVLVADANGQTHTIAMDPAVQPSVAGNAYLAKEWSITDDVLNVADSFACTIANDDGEASSIFEPGQKIIVAESDPAVANGKPVKHFTGRIVEVTEGSDLSGGSVIAISAMDLGWHLTSCKAEPLKQIKNRTFHQLLDICIDPSWGFGPTVAGNDLNTRLKHGRQVIVINHKPQLGAVLPFIQIEPGQQPIDLIRTYAAREGFLVNVSADGGLVIFQPSYDGPILYSAHYHGSREDQRTRNNMIGRPQLRKSIDGMYSEVQCWSTVVIPSEVVNAENPNEMYRHSKVTASPNPLQFFRREVISDGEAINETLRKNRATFKMQLDAFNSWEYTAEFQGHSQGGAFFVSNTMISIDDTVHKVSGAYYVQAVRRSCTLAEGVRSRLTIRKPILNPQLQALSSAARKALQ